MHRTTQVSVFPRCDNFDKPPPVRGVRHTPIFVIQKKATPESVASLLSRLSGTAPSGS